ncbi:MAG: DUF58 domain-containing protein [Burkholderiaceae bacterium]
MTRHAPRTSALSALERDPLALSLSELVNARLRWLSKRTSLFGWGLEQGSRRSRRRGVGSEFDTIGPYQDGDDPRHIDWHATARTGQAQVRRYFHESHRPVVFAVDLRSSMYFGTRDQLLSKTAALAAAALSWDVAATSRPLALFWINGGGAYPILCRAGRRHYMRSITELHNAYHVGAQRFVNGSGISMPLDLAMERWAPSLGHRADLILISDFSERGNEFRFIGASLQNLSLYALCIEDSLTTRVFSGRFPLSRHDQPPDQNLSVGRKKPSSFRASVEDWRRDLENDLYQAGYEGIGFCHSADISQAANR